MAWIELFLSYARDGLPQPVDLEFLLPDSGPQRQAIMAEVDAVAQYHYRLKVAHEEKIRRRFEKGPPGDLDVVTGIEESDEAEILDTVMSGLRIDDTAVDMIDDDSSSDDEDDDEDEDVDSDHESKPHGHKDSPLLGPVPERFGPNAERDRRGSNSSTVNPVSTGSNIQSISQGHHLLPIRVLRKYLILQDDRLGPRCPRRREGGYLLKRRLHQRQRLSRR
jgi:hypothetical protein